MNVKKLRKKIGTNQTEFWGRVGVTQSGGSRYESGRPMPKPLVMLMSIAYGSERERDAVLKQLLSEK